MIQTLRHRNYLLLWLSQLISGVGNVLYNVGVMVTIFERTGSTLQTAGAMIATMLPPFLLGPFAGAIVDRYPRQRVLLAMDLVRALLVGGLLLLIQNVGFHLWGIYLIITGLAAASAFYVPARQAIIPSLVPKEEIVQANSLILTTTQATYALGFLLGGVLILRFDLASFILLNLSSFAVAAFLTAFIRTVNKTAVSATDTTPPLWEAIRTGAGYLRRHSLARPLVIMEVLEHVPHGIWTSALMLAFVTEALDGTATDWGYQNGAYFGAQIIGAVLAGILAHRLARRAGRVVVVNAFLNGFLTLIYALSPNNLFATALAFAFGPPMALRDVAQDSLLQTGVDDHFLGRVYAIRNMGLSVAFMLAGVFFAWLADLIPVRWIYGIGGVLYLGTAVYALANHPLRRAAIHSDTAHAAAAPAAAAEVMTS